MPYDRIPRAGDLTVERIRPGADVGTTFYALTGGNAGALAALMELVKCANVDPDAGVFSDTLPLEQLDKLGIHERFTYLLYNDLCERNAARVRAVLRAVDLGLVHRNGLADAIEGCRRPDGPRLNVGLIVSLVRQTLPNFDRANLCQID